MTVVAGIDEAGYGPSLGPLVVAASAFRLEAPVKERALDRLVGLTERAGGLAIDDSKKLYRGRADLTRLETSVLGHYALAHGALPLRVDRLLDAAVDLHRDEVEELPWYRARLLRTALPRAADVPDVLARTARQAELLSDRGVALVGLHVAPVVETRFNHLVRQYGSKAWPLFLATGRLVDRLMAAHPDEELVVRVDRQGGRQRYADALTGYFPLAPLRTLKQTPAEASYRLEPAGRPPVTLHFRVAGDGHHAPIALASVLAKTVRELFMESLNAWFAERVPGVKPTAGYAQDARRFLADVAPLLDDAAPRSQLVRLA